MLAQHLNRAAVVVPIVTDHTLYAPASTAMLAVLRRFIMPTLKELTTLPVGPERCQTIDLLHHYMLELQFILCQIEDVERYRATS